MFGAILKYSNSLNLIFFLIKLSQNNKEKRG